jgi:hypothetical protein
VRIAAALVVVSTLAHADVPRDAIERARELEARLAYDEALAIIEATIASGQANRARLVELHLFAGRLSAGLDRAKLAEDHFAVVLALDPARTLPDDTSPKLTVPFTVARTKTVALVVQLVVTETQVAVEAGPLVAGIALRLADGTTQTERTRTRVARPAQPITLVRALDRHGNELWSGTPPPDAPIDTPKPIVVEQPGMFARWTTWAAVTGVALAAGGVASWRFGVAQDDFDARRDDGMTDFSELRAIEDRGKRWGLVANISFGVAAATAITSVIFFVRRPTEPAVTVTAGGGTIGVAGRF